MRILILGAGAIGGYLGGRLIQAGKAEVAFLVRGERMAQLERDGLTIDSPVGDFKAAVNVVTAETVEPYWDVIVLTCKAYDLEDAMKSVRLLVSDQTVIVPLLNGMSHIDQLRQTFGAGHVAGGVAYISVTLMPDGVVRHLTPLARFAFGELDGRMSGQLLDLQEAFAGASIEIETVPDITSYLWEKLVALGSMAAATVLMRANVGEIVRAPGGAPWLGRLIERGAAIAAAEGYPVRQSYLDGFLRPALLDPKSTLTASMLRDLEAGNRIEADHILGYLLDAARRNGVPDDMHEAAYIHAKAYENRRVGRG